MRLSGTCLSRLLSLLVLSVVTGAEDMGSSSKESKGTAKVVEPLNTIEAAKQPLSTLEAAKQLQNDIDDIKEKPIALGLKKEFKNKEAEETRIAAQGCFKQVQSVIELNTGLARNGNPDKTITSKYEEISDATNTLVKAALEACVATAQVAIKTDEAITAKDKYGKETDAKQKGLKESEVKTAVKSVTEHAAIVKAKVSEVEKENQIVSDKNREVEATSTDKSKLSDLRDVVKSTENATEMIKAAKISVEAARKLAESLDPQPKQQATTKDDNKQSTTTTQQAKQQTTTKDDNKQSTTTMQQAKQQTTTKDDNNKVTTTNQETSVKTNDTQKETTEATKSGSSSIKPGIGALISLSVLVAAASLLPPLLLNTGKLSRAPSN